MKKGVVAATMTMAASLGLGGPLAAVAKTHHQQQNAGAPAAAPETEPQTIEFAPAPAKPKAPSSDPQQDAAVPPVATSEATAVAQAPEVAPTTPEAPQPTPSPDGATSAQAPEATPAAPEAAQPAPSPEGATAAQGSEGAPAPEASQAAPPPEAAAPGPEAAPAPGAPPAAAEQTGGIETVVVTARRTAENLQKVPVAISAFSDKDLARENITTGQDLAGRVPSLVINSNSQGRNTETPTIRGQGATFGASPGVIMYYAEVPLPSDQISNGQGGPGKFFDLSNLQILKGSQGTLFGRNTTGGALLLEPHKPDAYYSASVKGEASNFQGKGVEGIVNVPVVEDKLFLRLATKFYERKGFTKDAVTGEDYDNKGYRTMRMGLMWKPADGIQNYLLGYYTHSADNGTSQVLEQINNQPQTVSFPITIAGTTYNPAITLKLGCVFAAAAGGTVNRATINNCGQDVLTAQQARGVRSVELSTPPDDILDTQALIDSFSYELNDLITLRNIGSYSLYKHTYKWDIDGSSLALNDISSPSDTDSSNIATYTEEAQLQGNFFNHSLKFVGGTYYEYLAPQGTEQNSAISFGVANTRQNFSISRRSYGPYAQGTQDMGAILDALDGLNTTLGIRYSIDDQDGEAQTQTFLPAGTTPIIPGDVHGARVKSEAITYTAGVDYKIPTTLLYGKISHGYKAGGFSPIAVNPDNYTFKPEFVMNYEIGNKSDFRIGDMPFRVNSALYYTDYTNMQRTAGDSYHGAFGGATYTAGSAAIMGFETDATVQPFDGFTVTANYSYTYGKYNTFDIKYTSMYGIATVDCTGQTVKSSTATTTTHIDLACVPFQFTPRHQASVSMRYQVPVDEALGKMDGSVTYSFTDRQYSSATSQPKDEPGAWLGAYGILNAGFGWSGIYGSAFDLQLFGANLTDRTYRLSNSNEWNVFFFQSSIYGEPRTFGMSLGYHWDK